MADSTWLPMYSLSDVDSFQKGRSILELVRNQDTLELWVVNRHTQAHSLSCVTNQSVAAGDSVLFTLIPKSGDPHYFALQATDESENYLGLHTLIAIKEKASQKLFIWQLEERSLAIDAAILNQQAYDFANYDPTYFLINKRYNPQTLQDSFGRVVGGVGDSLYILVVNWGHADHSLHFHGYHIWDLDGLSKLPAPASKDTLPVRKGESGRLLLVPDKTGEYPVHDHNLVAVSGGGVYPNGMFTTLLIQ